LTDNSLLLLILLSLFCIIKSWENWI
jgi:hypothetical protein